MGEGRVGVHGSRQSLVPTAPISLPEFAKAHVEGTSLNDSWREWDHRRSEHMIEPISDKGQAF